MLIHCLWLSKTRRDYFNVIPVYIHCDQTFQDIDKVACWYSFSTDNVHSRYCVVTSIGERNIYIVNIHMCRWTDYGHTHNDNI